jgi:exodeoxyribonuclease VII large subunit
MSIEFSDGRVGVTANASERTAAPQPAPREQRPAAPKRATKPVDQGSLF